MGVIFYFSTQQTAEIIPETVPHFIFFKSLHILEYATLAVLIFFALLKEKQALIFAYLYALSDEIHQTFISGRSGRFKDTLIDLLGIIIGLYVLKQLRKIEAINRFFI
jgi:VanZ family protein